MNCTNKLCNKKLGEFHEDYCPTCQHVGIPALIAELERMKAAARQYLGNNCNENREALEELCRE